MSLPSPSLLSMVDEREEEGDDEVKVEKRLLKLVDAIFYCFAERILEPPRCLLPNVHNVSLPNTRKADTLDDAIGVVGRSLNVD
jgi:hypothetical protein